MYVRTYDFLQGNEGETVLVQCLETQLRAGHSIGQHRSQHCDVSGVSVHVTKCMAWWDMVCYGMIWYGMVWYGLAWHGVAWYSMLWCDMLWYVMVLHGIVCYGMAYCGMAWCCMV